MADVETVGTAPRWLSDSEIRAWRAFIGNAVALLAVLDNELEARHGLSLGDYEVLVHLSEAPGNTLRMHDLAARLHLSPSGITRRIDGLVRRGLGRAAAVPDRPARVERGLDGGRVRDAPSRCSHARHGCAHPLHRPLVRTRAGGPRECTLGARDRSGSRGRRLRRDDLRDPFTCRRDAASALRGGARASASWWWCQSSRRRRRRRRATRSRALRAAAARSVPP